jgi:predicted transport protein
MSRATQKSVTEACKPLANDVESRVQTIELNTHVRIVRDVKCIGSVSLGNVRIEIHEDGANHVLKGRFNTLLPEIVRRLNRYA